jgi:hypothetical protein
MRSRMFSFVASLALVGAGLVAASGSASAANLIANPGFETGSTSGWECSSGTVTRSPVHSGTYALATTSVGVGVGWCSQTIAVKPNTAYTVSVWVYGGPARLAIDLCCSVSTTAPTASYTTLSMPFTSGASQTTAELLVHGFRGAGTVYFDDVVLDVPGRSTS